MKKLFLTPVLVLGLVLLTACSENTAPPTNDSAMGDSSTDKYDSSPPNDEGSEDVCAPGDENCEPPTITISSDQEPMNDETADTADTSDTFSQVAPPQDGDMIATIRTNMGSISIRLFPEQVPKTVENFATHAKNGYYDGLIFHRVMKNFMIQGGDPVGNGTGGESIWGGKFDDEFDEDLSNVAGSIAMANAGPNTNGSQFFINQIDNSYLDFDKKPFTSKHAVFGQVFEGMDIVNTIANVQTNSMSKPLEDVVIETITISEY